MTWSKEELLAKGWSKEEVDKAFKILNKPTKKNNKTISKSSFFPTIGEFVYWMALLLTIFGNMIVVFILAPILMLTKGIAMYFFIITIGGSFGYMFNHLIKDLEKVQTEKQLIAGLFIPSMALISITVMVLLVKNFAGLEFKNMLPIIALYVLAFSFFYLKDLLVETTPVHAIKG
ncbi:hypothetical protein GOV04_05485 [Candidatus Woesearchaeota archaeon]|nr:hypothetical protein [Candidatus Woesearchaeota archaeon]